ncbi:MAG: hypothetical protein ACOVSR_12380 [Bacteroidia bacterium]
MTDKIAKPFLKWAGGKTQLMKLRGVYIVKSIHNNESRFQY